MQVKLKEKEGIVSCYISEEINIDTVADLKDVFKKIICDNSRKVILNFKDLDYIDSSGLACLIQFSQDLRNIQGALFLSDVSPKVRSIFAITKLEKALSTPAPCMISAN
jgi:anti-sigma B factor antagonist